MRDVTAVFEIQVIKSAREITRKGLKSDQELAKEIGDQLLISEQRNPFHITDLLEKVRDNGNVSENAKSAISELLVELQDQDNGTFRHENAAYQAVVSRIRGLPKPNYHVHIGSSVHPGFAWNEFSKGKKTLTKVLATRSTLPSEEIMGLTILWTLVKQANENILWHDLDTETQDAVWNLFRGRLLKPSKVVSDTEGFCRQIQHVALQHALDGVTDLLLLVKFTRREFENDPIELARTAAEAAAKVSDSKAAAEALKEAGSCMTRLKVTLGVSFPRDGEHDPKYVENVVTKLVRFRNENDLCRAKIVAVDISGPEFLMDHRLNTHYWATSDYADALQIASNNGMANMAHLGDWGNTYRVPDNVPSRCKDVSRRKAISEIPDREKMVKHLLEFTRDGIETLRDVWQATPENAKEQAVSAPVVNHGIALATQGSWITKGPRRGYSFAGESISDETNIEEIVRQLTSVNEDGVEIRSCPTVNVRTEKVSFYRHHPFWWWLRMGVKCSLHVDDFYWHGTGTTLSDDIAKMILAAPAWAKLTWEDCIFYLDGGNGKAPLSAMTPNKNIDADNQ